LYDDYSQLHYLSSELVLRICGNIQSIPIQMLSFNTGRVLPQENHYVFWQQKNLCHFDECNNCSHEGSNAAMKSHAAAILPGHFIGSAGS
jgi:hypothetical protein